jgi:DNA polymerase
MRVRGTPQVHTIAARTLFLMPLLHPAAALRTPSLVDTLRLDFDSLRELMARPLPEAPGEPEPEVRADAQVEPEVEPADQLGLFG